MAAVVAAELELPPNLQLNAGCGINPEPLTVSRLPPCEGPVLGLKELTLAWSVQDRRRACNTRTTLLTAPNAHHTAATSCITWGTAVCSLTEELKEQPVLSEVVAINGDF